MNAIKLLAYSGGEWVIYVLVVCSVLVLAVIVDRALVLYKEWKILEALKPHLLPLFEKEDWDGAARLVGKADGSVSRFLSTTLHRVEDGLPAVEEHAAAARISEIKILEKRLLILGTLGNNAPFIGLFGTVLGVIKSFHDLAEASSAGPEVVMQGLSEALVATAVGLVVAIPAVMAYNFFQKKTQDLVSEMDALQRLIMGFLKSHR